MKNPVDFAKAHSERIFEILKYTLGCGLGLFIKVGITAVFTHFAVSIWISYLVVQCIILLVSYIFHSTVTFKYKTSTISERIKNFLFFTTTVAVFKLTDYLLVVLGVAYFKAKITESGILTGAKLQFLTAASIVTVSIIIFALRYLWYRVIFKKKKNTAAEKNNTASEICK